MIIWPIADLKNPEADLCTKVGGVYRDIMKGPNNTWSCLWDGVRRWDGFPNRAAAICWFDEEELALFRGQEPFLPLHLTGV